MKKLIALLLALVMVMALAACGGETKAEAPAENNTPATEAPKAETPAEAPAEEAAAETHTIALANINEKGVFGKLVKLGFEDAAAKRGWELVYVDNNADGQTAVSNAELLAQRGDIEFVVDMNVDASVGQTIMDIFNGANIPVLACDIGLPGAPFYGIDSAKMGTQNGEWMAQWVKDNWDGAVDYVVVITQIASGDEVCKRVRNAPIAMADAGIQIGEVVEIEGENDTAVCQRRLTDFLTAHPDAEKVVVFTLNEPAGVGCQAAVEVSGRNDDVRIVSCNCNADFTEMCYATEGKSCWFATCANFPHLYGEECMQLMERYFAGEKLEGTYPCMMVNVTIDNIAEYFPQDNLPWDRLNG